MASILAVIELVHGRPHPGSLEVLGQGRRIGTRLGATVYAVLPCEAMPGAGDDDLLAVLSRHGADKVLLGLSPLHAQAPRWGTHGGMVMAACGLMQPSLLLFADTDGGREVAVRCAARLGAALLCDAWLEIEGEALAMWQGSGADGCRLDAELDFTVVAIVPPGRYAVAHGDEEAEAEVLELGPPASDFALDGEPAPGVATVVIGAGPTAEQLAHAVGGVRLDAGAAQSSPWPAPLAISLGHELGAVRAHRAVILGAASPDSPDVYSLVDEGKAADELAAELAAAIGEARDTGGATAPTESSKP